MVIMEKRCLNCMEQLNSDTCPNCGLKADSKAQEVILKSRYYLGNVFSSDSASTVYIAYDNQLNKKVLIRKLDNENITKLTENQPTELLSQRFLSSAKSIATVSLCNILPRTVDTFTENEAAYWVTDFFDGKNLKALLNSGIKISLSNALNIANQLLNGLKHIHNSNRIFGTISPETVYILKNGEVRLFGIESAFYDFTDDINCRAQLLNPSYAAPELFGKGTKISISCDVYSVAAILYRIITNQIPAISFLRKGGENLIPPRKADKSIPENLHNALLNALNWQTEKRTATPTAFLKELGAEKVKRKLSGAVLWANFLGFFQALYDNFAFKKNKKTQEKKVNDPEKQKGKMPFLWLWITIPSVILIALAVLLLVLFPTNSTNGADASNTSSNGEDIWYYGSGVETPSTSSNYVYGGNSSKKPSSSAKSGSSSSNSSYVECPDFTGYYIEQAKYALRDNSLLLGNITYEYSEKYPADFVIGQSVKKGTIIKKGSKIDLIISKGESINEKTVELPQIKGLDLTKAIEKLENAGFYNLEYAFVLSEDTTGTVISAEFESEYSADYKSKIIVTVSGEKVEVLDYSNKTVAEIKALNTGLTFDFITADGNPLPEDADLNTYTVVSQSVKEGAAAYKGMAVVLTVENQNISE